MNRTNPFQGNIISTLTPPSPITKSIKCNPKRNELAQSSRRRPACSAPTYLPRLMKVAEFFCISIIRSNGEVEKGRSSPEGSYYFNFKLYCIKAFKKVEVAPQGQVSATWQIQLLLRIWACRPPFMEKQPESDYVYGQHCSLILVQHVTTLNLPYLLWRNLRFSDKFTSALNLSNTL